MQIVGSFDFRTGYRRAQARQYRSVPGAAHERASSTAQIMKAPSRDPAEFVKSHLVAVLKRSRTVAVTGKYKKIVSEPWLRMNDVKCQHGSLIARYCPLHALRVDRPHPIRCDFGPAHGAYLVQPLSGQKQQPDQ